MKKKIYEPPVLSILKPISNLGLLYSLSASWDDWQEINDNDDPKSSFGEWGDQGDF